ncbi:MAG: 50S ribosomal protein L3 [Nitrososphaerota archaeon]
MGHRKQSRPRHGSLAYLPRGRASRIIPRIKYWPPYDKETKPLAFVCFKAGLTSAFIIDNTPNSPTYGTEIMVPVTVLAAPPMFVAGIVFYEKNEDGTLKTLSTIWSEKTPENIRRLHPSFKPNQDKLNNIEKIIDRIYEVRLLMMTQPYLIGLSKKPRLIEVKVGGKNIKDCINYAIKKLGSEISIKEVFKKGDFVDVIAVSKGKGFQGVVKRYRVKLQPRKSRKMKRAVASIGPWHPAYVMYTVPRSGQMGYHRRTEFNKEILDIEEDGSKYTPKGGWKHFGIIKTTAVLIKGTIPGTQKRPIILRIPAKPPKIEIKEKQITFIKV